MGGSSRGMWTTLVHRKGQESRWNVLDSVSLTGRPRITVGQKPLEALSQARQAARVLSVYA